MSTVETGIVKFFKEDKKFGFVTVLDAKGDPTTTELFFHYNNGYFLEEGTDEPEFFIETGTMVDGRVKHIRKPQKGDKVVFVRGSNARGDKVAKWGYAATWDVLVESIANRPVYRVVKSGTYYGKPSTTTVWQGQNIMELSAEHVLEAPDLGRRRGYDALEGGTADGGDMHWYFSIERQLPDGTWKGCKDPRVFMCCIPRRILRQHTSRFQPVCYHSNRR